MINPTTLRWEAYNSFGLQAGFNDADEIVLYRTQTNKTGVYVYSYDGDSILDNQPVYDTTDALYAAILADEIGLNGKYKGNGQFNYVTQEDIDNAQGEFVLLFNQPTNMSVNESPQNLSIFTSGNFDDVLVNSSNESIATVERVLGVWKMSAVSEGSVNITVSMNGTDIIHNVSISSQFAGITFSGFSSNPYLDGGILKIPSGATDFTNQILFPYLTTDTEVEFIMRFIVKSPITAPNFCLGIGKKSINSTYSAPSLLSHGSIANDRFVFWNVTQDNNAAEVSNNAIGFSINPDDVIDLSFKQSKNVFTIKITNVTTNNIANHTITNNLGASKNFLAPNTSRLAIWSFGGQWDILSVNKISNRIPNAKVTFIGDSKTYGYSAGSGNYELTFASIVSEHYGGGNNFAGDGDKTVEAVQTIDNSLQGVTKGQYVIVCIGRNDLATSVPTLTWQSNYSAIINKIKATGATVIHLKHIPESDPFTAVNSYIDSNFPDDLKIDPSAGWDMGTMLSTDSVHPNSTGHAFIADKIINSGYII